MMHCCACSQLIPRKNVLNQAQNPALCLPVEVEQYTSGSQTNSRSSNIKGNSRITKLLASSWVIFRCVQHHDTLRLARWIPDGHLQNTSGFQTSLRCRNINGKAFITACLASSSVIPRCCAFHSARKLALCRPREHSQNTLGFQTSAMAGHRQCSHGKALDFVLLIPFFFEIARLLFFVSIRNKEIVVIEKDAASEELQ
jgi:hypothetical protein